MRISSAFPSQYLKAADLQGRAIRVTMLQVHMEDIGSDNKPVLYFEGKEKGLVLNKTNANNIAFAYGDDTDGWPGGEVELFPTVVDFQGRSVDAIRVRVPPRSAAGQKARPAAPQQPAGPPEPPPIDRVPDDPNDDIPF